MKANFQIILLVITVVGSLFPQDLIAANRYSENAANKVYIDMIGELREMSKNIVIYSEQATAANMESFRKMRKTRNDADYLLTKLQYSDFAVNHKARFETIASLWKEISTSVDTIVLALGAISMSSEYAKAINESISVLLVEFNNTITRYANLNNANSNQIHIINSNIPLNLRITENTNKLYLNGKVTELDVDTLSQDITQFGQVLDAMINGNPDMKIDKVHDSNVQNQLTQLKELFDTIVNLVKGIKDQTHTLFEAKNATNNIALNASILVKTTTSMINSYK